MLTPLKICLPLAHVSLSPSTKLLLTTFSHCKWLRDKHDPFDFFEILEPKKKKENSFWLILLVFLNFAILNRYKLFNVCSVSLIPNFVVTFLAAFIACNAHITHISKTMQKYVNIYMVDFFLCPNS